MPSPSRLIISSGGQHYGGNAQTRVYRSKDPTDFGVDDDRYLVETLPVAAPEIIESHGQLYISRLAAELGGRRDREAGLGAEALSADEVAAAPMSGCVRPWRSGG